MGRIDAAMTCGGGMGEVEVMTSLLVVRMEEVEVGMQVAEAERGVAGARRGVAVPQ